jgi:hypothetical protein
LQGARADRASEEYYQNDVTWMSYYNNPSITASNSNASISYRPDRPHIKLTSPTGFIGIPQTQNIISPSYVLTDVTSISEYCRLLIILKLNKFSIFVFNRKLVDKN